MANLSFNEIKEKLRKEYKDYFEILDLDFQARELICVNEEKWQEILLKNLKNNIECEKILAQPTAYAFHEFYQKEYEKKLKIYNKIMEGVK